jgi:hypothetical protein
MVKLTEKQQRDLLIGLGAADFVTKGKITAKAFDAVMGIARAGGRALYGTTRAVAPSAARFAGRSAMGIARTAGTVALRHPYLTAGAIIYVNRDEAAQLLREGYEVVREETPGIFDRARDLGTPQEILEERRRARLPVRPALGGKRKKTKFNKAISLGMKAVKRSRNGGKAGKLTNAKKTFSTVTKTASKILKGRKVSNRGVTGTAARAMRKTLKGRGY